MWRLVRDLGDLTGLDIVAAARRCQAQDAAAPSGRPPGGAALALEALRWSGFIAAGGGRCRLDGEPGAEAARASRPHGRGIRRDGPIGPPPAPRRA